MIKVKAALVLGLAAVALSAPVGASGQGGRGFGGHDTNAPVDVSSQRIEVQDRADRAVLTGNVQVRQGDMNLACDRLTVIYANSARGDAAAAGTGGVLIKRLEASGNVVVTRPGERATSRFGIYDVDRKIVTMIGNVSLTRGASRVNGGRLVLDLDSGRAVMDGGGEAGGGRVTGRFTVPQTGTQRSTGN
jgi:lipopolysaccharide export system protein LptA